MQQHWNNQSLGRFFKPFSTVAVVCLVVASVVGCSDAEIYYFFKGTPFIQESNVAEISVPKPNLRKSPIKPLERLAPLSLPLSAPEALNEIPMEATVTAGPVIVSPKAEIAPYIGKKIVQKVSHPRVAVKKKATPQKRSHTKKHKAVEIEIPEEIEAAWWAPYEDDEAALNVTSPVEEIVTSGFEESSEHEETLVDSHLNVPTAGTVPEFIEAEERLITEVVGELVPNDYTKITSSLDTMQEYAENLEPVVAPLDVETDSEKESVEKTSTGDADVDTQEADENTAAAVLEKIEAQEKEDVAKELNTQKVTELPPVEETPQKVASAVTTYTPPILITPPQPMLVAPPRIPTGMNTQSESGDATNVIAPKKPSAPKTLDTQSSLSTPEKSLSRSLFKVGKVSTPVLVTNEYDNREAIENEIEVRLEADPDVEAELEEGGQHFEVYLRPVNELENVNATIRPSMDLEDPEHFSEYPNFFFPKVGLVGNYRLVAALFKDGDLYRAYSQVMYPEVVNNVSARGVVAFKITKAMVDAGKTRTSVRQNSGKGSITLLVSEVVASEAPMLPKIENASIRILNGATGRIVYHPDRPGEVTIEDTVPGTLMVEVRSPQHYPSVQIIPTHAGQLTYWRAQLIRQSWLTNMLGRYEDMMNGMPVIGGTINPNAGIVITRVCDKNSKQPLAGQQARISSRIEDLEAGSVDERPIYFKHTFPFPFATETSASGITLFLNVEEGLRKVTHTSGHAEMVYVRPGYAEYRDSGCSGAIDFKAAVVDSDDGSRVSDAEFRVARDVQVYRDSNLDGVYEIPALSLSAGLHEMEVKTEDNMRTWFPVVVDPLERVRQKMMFLIGKETLERNAFQVARQPKLVPTQGHIIGTIPLEAFDAETQCVRVELRDVYGRIITDKMAFQFSGTETLDPKKAATNCFTPNHRVFAFYNLDPTEYITNFKQVPTNLTRVGEIKGTNVLRVAPDTSTVSVAF